MSGVVFLATIAAMALWGLWALLAKITASYGQPGVVLPYEAIGHVIGVVIVVVASTTVRNAIELQPRAMGLAVLTGVAGAVAMLPFLYALRHGPALLVVPLTAVYPVITVILAVIFLKESFDLRAAAGIVFAVVAAFLLSR